MIELYDFMEIKHPIIYLGKEYNRCLFFYDANDDVVSFDDIPDNYPRWLFSRHHSLNSALITIRIMVNDGWMYDYKMDGLLL